MADLPLIGVRAIVDNIRNYVRDLGVVNAATKLTERNLKLLEKEQRVQEITISKVEKTQGEWIKSLTDGASKTLMLVDKVGLLDKGLDVLEATTGHSTEAVKGLKDELLGVADAASGGEKKKSASEGFLDFLQKIGQFNFILGIVAPRLHSFSDIVQDLAPTIIRAGGALAGEFPIMQQMGTYLTTLLPQLTAMLPQIIAVTAALAAAAAVISLGARGAGIEGITSAFNNLAESAGLTGDVLRDNLRDAAADSIPILELMKQTNIALAGATGQVRDALVEQIPKLLEISRAQAAATGRTVNELFESLVSGIKRSSPLLIDNTGLVLSIGQANEEYAASVHKTVEELTDEEQQLALLNATIEAGNRAIAMQGGILSTAAEKMAQLATITENATNFISEGAQPLFKLILDLGIVLIKPLEGLAFFFGETLRLIGEVGRLLFGWLIPIIGSITFSLNDFFYTLGHFTGFIANIFKFLADIVIGAVNLIIGTINWLIEQFNQLTVAITTSVSNAIGGFFDPLVQMIQNAVDLFFFYLDPDRFAFAGGFLIGQFAAGILAAGVGLLRIVRQLAQGIADFLVGQSPPPVGPLSTIDEAGKNLIDTFLGGFMQASLQPVHEVAANVQKAMGEIATFTLPQVETALRRLDKAIAPFEAQLRIVRANFEALSKPAEAALSAIDRQLEQAVQALAMGVEGSGDIVRQLDIQRASIEKSLDSQQALVDAAEIQLALARAQQIEERTLLELRKEQLGQVKKVSKEVAKVTPVSPGGGASKAPAGGAAKTPPKTGADVGDLTSGKADGEIGGGTLATDMGVPGPDWFGTGFAAAFGDGELFSQFNEESLALREQIGRITPDAIIDNFAEQSLGLQRAVYENFTLPFMEGVDKIVNWFTNTEEEGTLAYGVYNFPGNFVAWLGDLGTTIQVNLVDPAITSLSSFWNSIAGPEPTSLKSRLSNFFTGTEEGTLRYMLGEASTSFSAFVNESLPEALRRFGLVVWNKVAVPFINILNWIIGKLDEFLATISAGPLVDIIDQLFPNLERTERVPLPQIDTAPPSWITGARTGGLFTGGLLQTHANELVGSASKMAVFPASFVTAANNLANVMVDTFSSSNAAFANGGGNISNVNSTSSSNVINMPPSNDSQDAVRRLTMMGIFS